MKKLYTLAIPALLFFALILQSCGFTEDKTQPQNDVDKNDAANIDESKAEFKDSTVNIKADLENVWDAADSYDDDRKIYIELNSLDKTDGEGYTVSDDGFGTNITITEEGTYVISGELLNGHITVDAPKQDSVRLMLNNAEIHCSYASPVFVKSAKEAVIYLPDGTVNTIECTSVAAGETSENDDEEISAAVYSKADLSLDGAGTLNISSSECDGIRSNDILKITGGIINIDSGKCGLKGKDAVLIKNAEININSEGDGIKSANSSDMSKGYIYIESGKFNIASQNDGIQAETLLEITGGTFSITTGTGSYSRDYGIGNENQPPRDFGGFRGMFSQESPVAGEFSAKEPPVADEFSASEKPSAAEETTVSLKALKGGSLVNISGGEITVNSYDDAVHSNGDVIISGGTVYIKSGDDGIHADNAVNISGGDINIAQCYEGIEGMTIDITGGKISVVSSDDGLNATDRSGEDLVGMFSMNRNNSNSTAPELVYINIDGGELYIDAGGDGIDSNSTLTINGGFVAVIGPSDSGNGYIDTAGDFLMNGGTYIGIGSSGMLVYPSSSSAQNSVTLIGDNYSGGTVTVKDSAGNELISLDTTKQFNAVTFSSGDISIGEEYFVYADDELISSVTADSVSSVSGDTGGGFGFGGNWNNGNGFPKDGRNPFDGEFNPRG